MKSGRQIRPLQDNQRRASDPAASAWVSANAGSGKTFVLAARVLRLLLAGTPPDRLLCLTFTKAAAAEMANRVFDALRVWAVADDKDLNDHLKALGNPAPDDALRARARRLFAEALETPGGLKIQTINAFGESLLSRFPFEANVAADFSVIDDHEARDLMARARHDVFTAALSTPAGDLGRALNHVTMHADEGRIDELVKHVLHQQSAFRAWITANGGLDGAFARLAMALELDAGDSLAAVEADILSSPHLPRSEWASIAASLPRPKKTDAGFADALAAAEADDDDTAIAGYLALFLTQKWTVRKTFITKGVAAEAPELYARISAEGERLEALVQRLIGVFILEGSKALFTLCHAIIGHYEAQKAARGLIDYDDQIEKARQLLTRDQGAAWVLYKLDYGIDHILLDEAQDTNPRQWDIVEALSGEFFAGAGGRPMARTVFAVGDEKQSIFSFRGADPAMFDTMRRGYRQKVGAAGLTFHDVPLTTSFRTAQALLDTVDTVFDAPETMSGVVTGDIWPTHMAARKQEANPNADVPGRVELWPVIEPDPVAETDNWLLPVDAPVRNDTVLQNAARIAAVIDHWLKSGERIAPGDRAITPGDILILVRKRGRFAEAMIRELKRRSLPVAGADRIRLMDHIAIQDCLTLARFVLQANDDLTLAALLKSPLFGLNDDDLIALAPNRAGTLLAAVRDNPRYRETFDRLTHWLNRADAVTPFAFFCEVLSGGGRRRFHARMGAEVDDVLDEFLALILRYQSLHTGSLQGLVGFMEEADAEIKRDMDQALAEIRVMTVHGAKGLEAPIVFLADPLSKSSASHTPAVLSLDDMENGDAPPLVWRVKTDFKNPAVTRALDRAAQATDEESRRLLYVALTRARDRLYIAGHNTDRRTPADAQDGHWYAVLNGVLPGRSAEITDPYGLGFDVLRSGDMGDPGFAGAAVAEKPATAARPGWLDEKAVAEPLPPRITAPSSAWLEPMAHGPGDPAPRPDPLAPAAVHKAAARGRLIHRLLQNLPDHPSSARHAVADGFLKRHAADWTPEERDRMRQEVLALIEAPTLAALFAPGSRAEVPVTGEVETGAGRIRVAGIIDRIALAPENVILADYKTNATPPTDLDGVPPAYISQMAVYRALLADIYPGRSVQAVLIWTATGHAMPLASERLNTALGVAS